MTGSSEVSKRRSRRPESAESQEQARDRQAKINRCLLSFGADPRSNISRLTALC